MNLDREEHVWLHRFLGRAFYEQEARPSLLEQLRRIWRIVAGSLFWTVLIGGWTAIAVSLAGTPLWFRVAMPLISGANILLGLLLSLVVLGRLALSYPIEAASLYVYRKLKGPDA